MRNRSRKACAIVQCYARQNNGLVSQVFLHILLKLSNAECLIVDVEPAVDAKSAEIAVCIALAYNIASVKNDTILRNNIPFLLLRLISAVFLRGPKTKMNFSLLVHGIRAPRPARRPDYVESFTASETLETLGR